MSATADAADAIALLNPSIKRLGTAVDALATRVDHLSEVVESLGEKVDTLEETLASALAVAESFQRKGGILRAAAQAIGR